MVLEKASQLVCTAHFRFTMMKKYGLAKFGQLLGNISAGKLTDFKYDRREIAYWDLPSESKWIFNNVNIVDVDKGIIYDENAILIYGTNFRERLRKDEIQALSQKPEIEIIIDGKGQFLIPGMSDLHCHLSLIKNN
jgi:hypothetical protein